MKLPKGSRKYTTRKNSAYTSNKQHKKLPKGSRKYAYAEGVERVVIAVQLGNSQKGVERDFLNNWSKLLSRGDRVKLPKGSRKYNHPQQA